jgi:putative chitinase
MPLHLSPETLRKVVPGLSVDRATTIADLINKICPTYGIDSGNILHEFLATCAEESQEFSHKTENLNYSWPQLRKVFGKKYFRTDIEAQRFEHQPEKIANFVYGGRMGNNKPGYGWLFRGAGFIQMTGYEMFAKYGLRNNKTAEEVSNLVRTDDWWAMDSACWIFAVEKNLVPMAKEDKFKLITERINGGLNGYEERLKYYERAKQYIPEA